MILFYTYNGDEYFVLLKKLNNSWNKIWFDNIFSRFEFNLKIFIILRLKIYFEKKKLKSLIFYSKVD